MGVYIPGMDMPESCGRCRFNRFGACIMTNYRSPRMPSEYIERPDWCPVVHVPPHGRLIDADALISDLMHDVNLDAVALDDMTIDGQERITLQRDKDFKQNCAYWIANSPTIIQAKED